MSYISTYLLTGFVLIIKITLVYSIRYKAIIALLPVAACYVDTKNHKGFLNNKLCSLLSTKKRFIKIDKIFQHLDRPVDVISTFNKAVSTGLVRHISCCTYNHSEKIFCFMTPFLKKTDKKTYGVLIVFTKQRVEDGFDNEEFDEKILEYQKVFNKLPYLVWIRDKNMQINYFNNEYYRFVENRVLDSSSDTIELSNECIMLARDSIDNNSTTTRKVHIAEKNTLKTLMLTEAPLQKLGGSIGFGHDITHFMNLKKDSLKATGAYRNFFESLSNAISIYNVSMQLVFYNNAFVQIFNFEQSWLDNKPNYTEVLEKMREKRKLPEQADFAKFKVEQINLFNNLIDTHNEFHYLSDGTALRVAIIPGIKGELLFSHEDVTDKITLEQSYNIAIAVSKSTINNLHEAIAVYGEDGRLRLFNPSLQKMWDIDEGYLKTMPHISEVLSCTKEDYRSSNWEDFQNEEVLAITNKIKGERCFCLKNGKHINRNINILPDGSVLVTYREVTATKILEQSLRDKNSMLTELANLKSNLFSSISYELRSPLTSIIGFAEMILMFYGDKVGNSSLQYVSDIYQSAIGLSNIINNMLDFSSIESGVVNLSKEGISVTNIVDLLKEEKNSLIYNDPKVKIICNNLDDVMVEVDKQLVVKGLIHLIKYAMQILGKINTIEFVKIVNDNDKGVSSKMLNCRSIGIYVFNKIYAEKQEDEVGFVHLENEDVTNVNLTIIKRFVTWHGGGLRIKYQNKNMIKFICSLPAYQIKEIKAQ